MELEEAGFRPDWKPYLLRRQERVDKAPAPLLERMAIQAGMKPGYTTVPGHPAVLREPPRKPKSILVCTLFNLKLCIDGIF